MSVRSLRQAVRRIPARAMDRASRSEATTVRRDDRGHYDRATIDAILDEGTIAHVGLVAADGRPVVIPMVYARDGDRLLVHGSPATRLLRTLKRGVELCVTVTLLDGLVLARSAFHHSLTSDPSCCSARRPRSRGPPRRSPPSTGSPTTSSPAGCRRSAR